MYSSLKNNYQNSRVNLLYIIIICAIIHNLHQLNKNVEYNFSSNNYTGFTIIVYIYKIIIIIGRFEFKCYTVFELHSQHCFNCTFL